MPAPLAESQRFVRLELGPFRISLPRSAESLYVGNLGVVARLNRGASLALDLVSPEDFVGLGGAALLRVADLPSAMLGIPGDYTLTVSQLAQAGRSAFVDDDTLAMFSDDRACRVIWLADTPRSFELSGFVAVEGQPDFYLSVDANRLDVAVFSSLLATICAESSHEVE